jgi:pSer/pThr/pTyr-binding forkhead associated (FHA) protein
VSCLQPLDGAPPSPAGRPGSLVLSIGAGRIEVSPGQTVLLGRDETVSPAGRLLAAYDNVSRRHATAGVDADGAWIRDEGSTNGTWVDERRIPPGTVVRLVDGSVVRLARDVRLRTGLVLATEGRA